MSFREDIRAMVLSGDLSHLDALVAARRTAVRYLLGLTYDSDPQIRRVAARGLAIAGRHHPRLVQQVVRRLVWAMNDESGTNAVTAPEVLEAIAGERPDLLEPMVPDIVRLCGDPSLEEGLKRTLRLVTKNRPGAVGRRLAEDLSRPRTRRRPSARSEEGR